MSGSQINSMKLLGKRSGMYLFDDGGEGVLIDMNFWRITRGNLTKFITHIPLNPANMLENSETVLLQSILDGEK